MAQMTNQYITGLDNGLAPNRQQDSILTSNGMFCIGPLQCVKK